MEAQPHRGHLKMYFFAWEVFYFNKTEEKMKEAFAALPAGMKRFSRSRLPDGKTNSKRKMNFRVDIFTTHVQ